MDGAASLASGLAATVAGIALVRFGWSRGRRRGAVATVAGWSALAAGLLLLAGLAGAWGISVGAMAAMLGASLFLLRAAWASPEARERPVREPAPTVRLRPADARDLARRVGIFLIVVPGGFAASAGVSLALQALARAGGWQEANSTTLALLAFPLVWTLLTVVLMLRTRIAAMLKSLAGIGVVAGATLWLAA